MADETELAAIVIDNGTGFIKAGMASDPAPRKKFPTMLGFSRFQGLDVAMDQPDFMVGDKAYENKGILNIVNPIEKGIIKNFDNMERIWHHTFYDQLSVDPQEHPAMITDSPLNTFENKEKCTQLFFENLNVPSFYIASSAVLALIASGSSKGVVFDSGEGATHVVPIYECYALPHSTKSIDISGKDLTEYMHYLLYSLGNTLSKKDSEIVQKIKETKTHISLGFEKELTEFKDSGNSKDIVMELPDGNSISIGSPQIECPEILFKPHLLKDVGPAYPHLQAKCNEIGIHELIYKSYFAIDMEVRKLLFSKIVLAGGNTLFTNIGERIADEMKDAGGNSVSFKVSVPAERQYTAWIGGSILSSLSPFQSMWISKKEYEDVGESIVRRKSL